MDKQTNKIHCVAWNARVCYQYVAFPSLLGNEIGFISSGDEGCLDDPAIPFDCYVIVPKCDPVSKQIIHPCREMCHDYLNACNDMYGYTYNCDYLPARDGDIPCIYHLVRCTAPPVVKNATVAWTNDTAEYSCSEGFSLVGNKSITCYPLGRWSTPPQCLHIEPKQTNLFVLPVLTVCILIILIILIVVICKIRSRSKRKQGVNRDRMQVDVGLEEMEEPLIDMSRNEVSEVSDACFQRNRAFDAFVLYHFDSDDDFVLNQLLPELEETRGFKLCIHSRNFTPGQDIKDNIEEAIEGSNSAIIVMSQGFVDSPWCKEEFTHCYLENMQDAKFFLFVIMMQPADTLVNISSYMKTFFNKKTYLQVNDPDLFTKLATHLDIARLPKDDYVNNSANENHDNSDSDNEQATKA